MTMKSDRDSASRLSCLSPSLSNWGSISFFRGCYFCLEI